MILLFTSLFLPLIQKKKIWENRTEIWSTALAAGLERPILGWGFGNVEFALRETSFLLKNNLRFQYVDSSHNLILDYWVQGGIVGVILILYLIFLTFKKFISKKDRLSLGVFFGVLTVLQFNPVSVVTSIHFWWLIGKMFR